MPSYHLRRMMRFTCGKDGTAFERDTIIAPDLAAAIDIACARTATPPGLSLTGSTLSAPSGAVLWSAKALALGGTRLSPTHS